MNVTGVASVLREVIIPALDLLPEKMRSYEAQVLLLAICGQEARWLYRKQIGGPARGLWQFEKGGGVAGVLRHPLTQNIAVNIALERGHKATADSVYNALSKDDILAACFARLLLWTDPRPLPSIGDKDAAWAYYIRNWRPGKPHPKTWSGIYDTACGVVGER